MTSTFAEENVEKAAPAPAQCVQRIGIFVDVHNVFHAARLLHQGKMDYGRLLHELTQDRHLIRAVAYVLQRPDVNQSGFLEALTRLGYEVKVKDLKARPDADGRTAVKGSWDVGLTIDALNIAPRLDTVILVAGDSDYVPLVEALKSLGCRVEIAGFNRATAPELTKAADHFISTDGCVFKEKKFEAAAAAAAPVSSASSSGFGLGPTAAGKTVYEGLPRDED